VTAWAASTARRTVGFGEKAKARTLQKDIGMSWTDERVELLKKLWSDGLSASQIAAELGGITRNAVIGKVHRLGLSGRAKSASSAAPRPRKARSPMMRIGRASIRGNTALAHAYEMEAEAAPELIDNVIPIGQRRTILELTEQTCRWPVGDPGSTGGVPAGQRAAPGSASAALKSAKS
jgi:GcrA cell cycle regulator